MLDAGSVERQVAVLFVDAFNHGDNGLPRYEILRKEVLESS
jgi:hypothetical protein